MFCLLASVASLSLALTPSVGNISAVYDLLGRYLEPTVAVQFSLGQIPSVGTDSFTVANAYDDSVINVTSNTISGLCNGIGWYLRHVAGSEIAWSGVQIAIADDLPSVPSSPAIAQAIVPWRYYFNEHAHAFTTAFWSWGQWEYHLDWSVAQCVQLAHVAEMILYFARRMALNGINLAYIPLAQVSLTRAY